MIHAKTTANRMLVIAGAAGVSMITGCMPTLPTLPATPPAAPAAAPTAGAPPVQASPMSYGTVTSQVVKGKTTQVDLLQVFGGPNIATTDRDGVETWVYERTATQTDVQANSQSAQGALSLGAFFKYVDLQASGSMGRSTSFASTSSSIRSLTVIVKFGADKTVADYSVRASNF